MGKSKRDEIADAADDGYEFKLPPFDEKAFIRREVSSARASFYTLGLGFLAGVVSAGLYFAMPAKWGLGWIPILAAVLALRPVLQRLGFEEDVTSWKALAGSYFMLFFTGLSVWILGANIAN